MIKQNTKNIIYQQQTILGYVGLVILIYLITVISIEIKDKYILNIQETPFLLRLTLTAFVILIPISIVVAWRYAIPEKEGFISRFAACLKDGFLIIVGCCILFFTIIWLFDINNRYLHYLFFFLTLFSGVAGNKKITRGKTYYERGWVDAIIITLAQIYLVWAVLMMIAWVFRKR